MNYSARIFCRSPKNNQWLGGLAALAISALFWILIFIFLGISNNADADILHTNLCAQPLTSAALNLGERNWGANNSIMLSGMPKELQSRYAVQVLVEYDRRGLHFITRFRDPTPMVNHVDPELRPGEGQKADALLLGLQVAGHTPIQLLSYFYTNKARPVARLWRGSGDAGTAPLGVKTGFHKDGAHGYFQTLFVPWSLMGVDTPPQQLKLTLDAYWGNPQASTTPLYHLFDLIDPQHPAGDFRWMQPSTWGVLSLNCKGNITAQAEDAHDPSQELATLRYATTGTVSIPYRLPQAGVVTLIVETPDGRRVRNLMGAYPRTAGDNIDYWDGKDDDGKPVAAGRYRVRGLYHTGLDARYEFSFGAPGDPPWLTADTRGAWLANHTNPIAVLADTKRVYIAASYSEGPHALIAVDYQGRKLWGSLANAHAGPMALSGAYLYIVSEEGLLPARTGAELNKLVTVNLMRVDPQTGIEVPFDGARRRELATWNPQVLGVARLSTDVTAAKGYTVDWTGAAVLGIAAVGDTLYVPLRYSNRILKVNATTGEVRGSIAIERPAGVAINRDRLLVVTHNRVVQIDLATERIRPLIEDGLSAPVAIATGRDDRIYVSDWSHRMYVRTFSYQGKPIGTIGRPGGRAVAGAYDGLAMWLPRGISIDKDNRLWVAEYDYSPRRISVWNTDGTLAFERLGGTLYAGFGAYVLPDDPRRAIVLGNEIELDWSKRQWRVLATLWRPTKPGELIGLQYDARLSEVRQTTRGRYLIHSSAWRGGVTVISKLVEGRAVPVAAAGAVVNLLPDVLGPQAGGMNPPPLLAKHLWADPRRNAAVQRLLPWFFEGPKAGGLQAIYNEGGKVTDGVPPNGNFVWSDLNADGIVDVNEIHFYRSPGLHGNSSPPWRTSFWAGGVADNNLNLYFTLVNPKGAEHWQLPVNRWTTAGIPVYQPEKALRLTQSPYRNPVVWAQRGGHFLAIADQPRADRGGQTDPLVMFNPDGTVTWTYPSPYSGIHASHAAPKSGPGRLVGPLGVLGSATIEGLGDIFALRTNFGQAEFFTTDGLYIGSVFEDVRSAPVTLPMSPQQGMSVGNISNGAEWFGGQMFQRRDTGKVYLLMGREAANICQVTGLDNIRRLPESIVELPELDKRADAKNFEAPSALPRSASLKIQPLDAPIKPEQNPAHHWPSEFAHWRYDEQHAASASWTWDSDNLYVLFKRVTDATPMVNGGDDPARLFKPGDAALFEIATRSGQGANTAVDNKIRLVFSVYHGKPVAVLYRYGITQGKNIQRFTSPTGEVRAQVQGLEHASIHIDREPGAYQLWARVPLREIGFNPKPNLVYRGDFGVVYANAEGLDNSLRMYWSNRRGGLVSDLAGEANIDPSQWGSFSTERPGEK